ncbi:hypothetical protein ALC53_12181 [Atta colombica]|uniref:Uncharacterized protein n=1 Tax=Atta colombica TaxID=520822 RepID=A0A195AZC8_9HYME|nr:hypothetical protein ALC53_12181 [Atta colombica]
MHPRVFEAGDPEAAIFLRGHEEGARRIFEIASTNDARGTVNDSSLNNLHDYEERNKRQSISLPRMSLRAVEVYRPRGEYQLELHPELIRIVQNYRVRRPSTPPPAKRLTTVWPSSYNPYSPKRTERPPQPSEERVERPEQKLRGGESTGETCILSPGPPCFPVSSSS